MPSLIRRHRLWAVAALAIVLRGAYVVAVRPDPMNMVDSAEYDALARGILAGHGIETFVSYSRPPLYPLFVAICYVLGGVGTLIVAQLLIGAATAPLVGALARRLSGRADAATVAATLVAVYPWFFQWVGGLASETLFTFLLIATLVLILRASDDPRPRPILIAGIVFGLTSLTRANALILAPPIALWWWWRAKDLRPPVILAVGVVLALLPYTSYNLATGNGLVVGSNGGGLSFYVGNNPDTARFYDPATSDAEWRALNRVETLGPEALARVGCPVSVGRIDVELREMEQLRACLDKVPPGQREMFWYRAAFTYITSDPAEWGLLEVRKLAHYWRPWVEPRVYSGPIVAVSGLSFGLILVLAVAGLVRMPRRMALFVVAVAVGSTLSSVVWNVQLRYRFAMLDPVLIAAAAEPLLAFAVRLRDQVPVMRGSAKTA